MIPNERHSPFHRQPYQKPFPHTQTHQAYGNQTPRPQDDTLATIDFAVERKTYRLALKENPRGRFVRITESNGTHFNSVVIPASGLELFLRTLKEVVAAEVTLENEVQPAPEPEAPVAAAPIAQAQVEPVPVSVPEPTPVQEPEPAPAKKAKSKPKASTKVKAVKKVAAVKKVKAVKKAKAPRKAKA